jgi:hypothetical protein
MPQLDKLTFTSQIFWFFLFFVILYYFFVQVILLRIKFSLGLRRFFLKGNLNFYELAKYFNLNSRNGLIFFFYNEASENYSSRNLLKNFTKIGLGGYIDYKFFEIQAEYFPYIFILNYDRSYYGFFYTKFQREKNFEFKKFDFWNKNLLAYYDNFSLLMNSFFKAVQFYIYEVNFTLFYYFFNIFLKFKNILYYIKLINCLV